MATGDDNGRSWEDAFIDLQDALALAFAGQEIWVAAGTYLPTSDTNREVSFVMVEGVALYGGFAGTETSLAERLIPPKEETIFEWRTLAAQVAIRITLTMSSSEPITRCWMVLLLQPEEM